MRTAMLMLIVLLLLVSVASAWASIVIHDGTPGIVAFEGPAGVALDSYGHVWALNAGQSWLRQPEYDPPVLINEIKFWCAGYFVTIYEEGWAFDSAWHSIGTWPDLPASMDGEAGPALTALVSPNPTSSASRVVFQTASEGPVSVAIVDASGRIVRLLLDGPHPAGDYSLKWDGKDDAGRELPAGVYFTHVTTADGTTTGRVVLAR